MKPLLSIIIPFYNCGPVIERCINSIDYNNAEIIIVNDGSRDSDVKLLNQAIENSNKNIRLINKENGGVSSARNIGLQNATGKYIVFIDADDYIVPDGLERIIDIAEESGADVVKYSARYMSYNSPLDKESIKFFNINSIIIEGKSEALNHYDISDYVIWDGLFLRSTISDNNIWFNEDQHLREDDVFMGKVYSVSNKVISTDLPIYRYVRNSNFSSTHNQNIERQRLLIKSGYNGIINRSNFIKEHCPNQDFPLEKYKYMRWVCNGKLAVSAKYSYTEYKQILKDFKDLGVYPLSYKMIKIGRFDYSLKNYLKWIIKVSLYNMPFLDYYLHKYLIHR